MNEADLLFYGSSDVESDTERGPPSTQRIPFTLNPEQAVLPDQQPIQRTLTTNLLGMISNATDCAKGLLEQTSDLGREDIDLVLTHSANLMAVLESLRLKQDSISVAGNFPYVEIVGTREGDLSVRNPSSPSTSTVSQARSPSPHPSPPTRLFYIDGENQENFVRQGKPNILNLPNEVMGMIFSSLKTGDLLGCRLVCKYWWEIVSWVGRERNVSLDLGRAKDESDLLVQCKYFNRTLHQPWSCITMPKKSLWTESGRRRVIEVLGDKIFKFSLQPATTMFMQNCRRLPTYLYDIADLLRLIPNVRELNIMVPITGHFGTLNRNRTLRRLIIVLITDDNLDFIESLLSSSVRLDYVKMGIKITSSEMAGKVARLMLLPSMHSRSLSIHNALSTPILRVLLNKQVLLSSVHLYLDQGDGTQDQYDVISKFIAISITTLKELGFTQIIKPNISEHVGYLNYDLPHICPVLEHIRFYSTPGYLNVPFHYPRLSGDEQFPALRSVSLQNCSGILFNPGELQYQSVKELSVENLESLTPNGLIKIFPNIEKVKGTIFRDNDALFNLFGHTQLEHLILDVFTVGDVNLVLAGIHSSADENIPYVDLESGKLITPPSLLSMTKGGAATVKEDEIYIYRNSFDRQVGRKTYYVCKYAHCPAKLNLHLSGLRILELTAAGSNWSRLNDSGVDLVLLRLQQLEQLYLNVNCRNRLYQISENNVKKLKSRHLIVRMLEDPRCCDLLHQLDQNP